MYHLVPTANGYDVYKWHDIGCNWEYIRSFYSLEAARESYPNASMYIPSRVMND